MFIPSYLIRSRHHIFYFRYPVGNERVSMSLKTRCPKEALRLARTLEHHAATFLQDAKEDAQLMSSLRGYPSIRIGKADKRQWVRVDLLREAWEK